MKTGVRQGWTAAAVARGRGSALALLLVLGGCQSGPPARTDVPQDVVRCEALFAAQDRAIADAGAGRSHPARIAGFPYLRATRFLASYRDEPGEGAQRDAWLARLAAADAVARSGELALLTPAAREQLARGEAHGLAAVTARCRERLLARDRASPARRSRLREHAVVADEYSLAQRALGLYPVARVGLRAGVLRWHAETRAAWAAPLASLRGEAPWRRYAPAGVPIDAGAAPPPVRRDALGLPLPTAAELARLFQRHAPVWVVATASDADRPGAPRRTAAGPGVAPEPLVYRYHTLTRFRGRARLQLNYLVWFDERPSKGPLDILAGALDGVLWRVTLDDAGAPLAWDSVHACGCYHLFFPAAGVRARSDIDALPEPPLVLDALAAPAPGERMHLYLTAGAHYLERARPERPDAAAVPYRLVAQEELYGAPAPGGERGLFGADGLVPGSERAERWYLWPSGVRSPGAMRERGRRATAFVGRRHFDDPFLLDRVFE